jgi:hypothetical protein
MRGFHTSFYLVELPSFTSTDDLQQMVFRFRRHLHRELALFVGNTLTPMGHAPSESNSSFVSDATHFSTYTCDPIPGNEVSFEYSLVLICSYNSSLDNINTQHSVNVLKCDRNPLSCFYYFPYISLPLSTSLMYIIPRYLLYGHRISFRDVS